MQNNICVLSLFAKAIHKTLQVWLSVNF